MSPSKLPIMRRIAMIVRPISALQPTLATCLPGSDDPEAAKFGAQPKLHAVVANPFTGPERRRLIERTEELLGRRLAGLIEKHRNDQHEYPHRLIELHLRLLRAEDNADDPMADNTSLVAGTEIAGVLDQLDKWRADPVWSEYQRGLSEAREYVHTAPTMCFANALRTRHPATELVPSGGSAQTKSRKETPIYAWSSGRAPRWLLRSRLQPMSGPGHIR